MTDYISREAAIEKLKEERNYTGKLSFEEEHAWSVGFQQGISFALSDIASLTATDVVPVGAYNQAAWERDTAIEQLKQIGKSFGEQMDDVRPVVRCKECRHRDPEDHKCDSGETERQGCPFPVHDDYFCAYGER